ESHPLVETQPHPPVEPVETKPRPPVEPTSAGRAGREPEPVETSSLFTFTEEPPSSADDARHVDHERERPGWLVPTILTGLAVLLLIAAYAVGKAFSDSVTDSAGSSGQGSLVMGGNVGSGQSGAGNSTGPSVSKSTAGQNDGHTKAPDRGAYRGAVSAVSIGGATASCESPPAFDAAHHKVVYSPGAVYDGNMSTAWRCNGDGVGQTLTLALPSTTTLGEVGLIPGYAKTDPRNGADRYAENDRITKVRWDFGSGHTVVQHLDGSAHNRSLQTIRIPKVRTDRVVVHILASTPGPRHTVAVSEVRLAAPATS
ncbi:MAG: NADase-type glycan-binding domain-containing protein, partial [Nocardioidaceae bacterium]